jgi:hypothetical protein
MKKKTEIAIAHFENENIKTALKIASEFRIGLTEEERKQIKLGYECMVHRDFYLQIGRNPAKEIDKAIHLFIEKIQKPYVSRGA